jgi:hypothetical protein
MVREGPVRDEPVVSQASSVANETSNKSCSELDHWADRIQNRPKTAHARIRGPGCSVRNLDVRSYEKGVEFRRNTGTVRNGVAKKMIDVLVVTIVVGAVWLLNDYLEHCK